ncbi:hypothetical protein [Thermococcus sp.]
MKWFRPLIRRKKRSEDGVEYIKSLLENLLSRKGLYRDEVLLRDTVDELYTQLKKLALEGRNQKIIMAYEKAVILKYLSDKEELTEKEILEEILRLVGR